MEEIYKIYHIEDNIEDAIRPCGVYAHGHLAYDLGYDIIKISLNFVKNIDDNDYAKVGKYKCSWGGRDCILFVRPRFIGKIPVTQGLCCYTDDEEALKQIKNLCGDLF